MVGVCSVTLWRQKAVGLYWNPEEENPRIERIVFKLWVENKGAEEVTSRECIWWAKRIDLAAKAIDHPIEIYNCFYGWPTESRGQSLKQVCETDEVGELKA